MNDIYINYILFSFVQSHVGLVNPEISSSISDILFVISCAHRSCLCVPTEILSDTTLWFVIPHLETRADDWSKSHHVMFTKSGYFPHEAILPPLYVNIASIIINIASMSSAIFLNNS